ncbi:MAG: SsrA-binding protein SmpB [Candidatus Omnitrophica bacterium]|nr:SsrA-binding protein SmpB [Candidatus Omnitrophota bacterium]
MAENIIVTNRKALRDYFIIEAFEAGIALKGSEIKSIRKREVNLKDSFARVEKGGVLLYNMHISPYEFSRREEVDPTRPRKLLLKKSEIRHLAGKMSLKGQTLIPLKIYLKKGLAKIELALARGKKFYDKREALKAKEAKRDVDRALRRKR